jgi:16S rRNA G966 N2-methylase RsmD
MGRRLEGWTQATRERIAGQLSSIRHWKIAEADYAEAPDVRATWFVDPPYEGAGRYYAHSRIDYAELAQWSRSRQGQVIVCENEGATWLPFRPFMTGKSVMRRAGSREAIFHHLT